MLNGFAKFSRESYWARFLIPVGIILIIISVFLFINNDITKNYVRTEAVVSRVEEEEGAHYDEYSGEYVDATYKIFVKYTVDSHEYEAEYGIFPRMNVGDKVTICYDASDPTKISQPPSMILAIIMLSLGVLSVGGGIASIVMAVKKQRKLKEQEKEWETNGN